MELQDLEDKLPQDPEEIRDLDPELKLDGFFKKE